MFWEFKRHSLNISDFISQYMVENTITVEIMHFFIYFFETRKGEIDIDKYQIEIICEFKNIIEKGEVVNRANKRAYGYEISKLIFKIYWIFIKEILKCDEKKINSILSNGYMNNYLKGILCLRDSNNLTFINNSIYNWNFSNCDFSNFDFDYADLKFSDFSLTSFNNCSFVNADLKHVCFTDNEVKGFLDYSYSDLEKVLLKNVNTYRSGKIYMNYVKIKETHVKNCDITNWSLVNIIYLGELILDNVTLSFQQVEKLNRDYVKYENVKLIAGLEVVTNKDLISMKKDYKKDEKNWDINLDNYIETFISRWEQNHMSILREVESYKIVYDKKKIKTYINKEIQKK